MDNQLEDQAMDAESLSASLKRLEAKLENLLARPTNQSERGYCSLKNASFYSDLSQKSIRRLISKGDLQDYRPARGKILIKLKELDALIQKSTAKIRRGRGIRR